MTNTAQNSYLETQKLGKLICKYSLPCIISLLVGALYNIVDQIYIANAEYLGSYGNAANSVVFPMTVIALAAATMIGDGTSAFFSMTLGARQDEKAAKSIGNAIVMTVLSSVVVTAVYLVFADGILCAFGAQVNAETYALSKEYFFWISLGIPFYMFGQAMNPIIRSDGSPRFAMVSLLCGAAANCVLDPLFIYTFHIGMTGAAVATVIGQIISAAFSLYYVFFFKSVKLSRECFKPDFYCVKKILSLGFTSFLSQVSIVFTMAAVLNMCRKYGARDEIFGKEMYAHIPTAVIGIVMKFFQIVISASVGLSAGCIPVAGYNMGARKYSRVKKLLLCLTAIQAAVGFAAAVVFLCFPQFFINIFGAAHESVYYNEFALKCIRLFMCMTAFALVNKGTFIFLQSIGRAWESALLSLLRETVFGVGLVLVLPVYFGLYGILCFMPVADTLTFIISAAVIFGVCKSLSKAEKESDVK